MPQIQNKVKACHFLVALAAACSIITSHAADSRLSSGLWVEVAVDSTGMQEISHDELRALGFKNPESVRVYGYGQSALFPDNFTTDKPDDLPQQPVMHHNGRLLFYGEAAAHTTLLPDSSTTRVISPYSFESRYYLSDNGGTPALPDASPIEPSGDEVDSHTALIYIERERLNPSGHGTGWYDTTINSTAMASYSLRLDGMTREWRPRLTVRSVSINAGSPTISVTAANSTVTQTIQKSSAATFTTQVLHLSTEIPAQLTAKVSTSAKTGFVATDWLTLIYPRANTLGDKPQQLMLLSASQSGRPVRVAPGVEVWDVTSPAEAKRMPVNDNGTFTFEESGQTWLHFIAFNPDATQITPRIIGPTGNQNLHAAPTPQMLVIAGGELLETASGIATLHPDLDVLTVDAADIYREFGSGVRSAPAIRRFIKMLQSHNPGRLKYILLVGDVSQDNRGIDRGAGTIPTYQSNIESNMHDTTLSFWSTAYYSCTAESYNDSAPYLGRPTAAVGIIPAHTSDQLQTYLAKLEHLLSPTEQRLRSRHDVMLVNDYGDNALYTTQADLHDNLLRTGLDCPVTHKVYSDIYSTVGNDMPLAREAFIKATEQFPAYMLYIGHAEYNFLTSDPHWLQSAHLATLKFPTVPVMLLSTCRTTAADIVDSAIGAELLFNPDNGAASVIGNCRFSLSNYNQKFATKFSEAWIYASATPARIGDLWLKAFNNCLDSYTSSMAGSINTQKFILLGDPAMPLPHTTASINAALPAASLNPIAGDMLTGTTDITSGRVEATAYADDTPTYLSGRGDTRNRGRRVSNNNRRLWSGGATITDGHFKLPVNMPVKALDGSNDPLLFHIVVKAWSDDSRSTARTSIEGLTLAPSPGTSPQPQRPIRIVSMHTNSDETDITPGDATITAEIDGGSTGLSRLDGTLKAPVQLTLDGKQQHNGEITTTDDNVIITYRLNKLPDGQHRAKLQVTDNAGATDSMTIEFTIINRTLDISLAVDDPIAHDEAVVTVAAGDDLDECRLIITDTTGDTVLSLDLQPGTWTWSLLDSEGHRVAPGNYRLQIMARAGRRHAASAPVTVTVLTQQP